MSGSQSYIDYPGRTVRSGNGRFQVIPVILQKRYSDRKFLGFFPMISGRVSAGNHRKLAGIHRKKSEKFPAGILLPCSIDFWCFPAGYDDFPASFLQESAGSGPGIIDLVSCSEDFRLKTAFTDVFLCVSVVVVAKRLL